MEVAQVIDRFEQIREKRTPRLCSFLQFSGPGFLVIQRPGTSLFDDCNDVNTICGHNLKYLENSVQLEWSDDIPYLEPCIGTGVALDLSGKLADPDLRLIVEMGHDPERSEDNYKRMRDCLSKVYES